MISISSYPRCRGYLLGMEKRALENAAMTPYFVAVTLADAWDDEVLAASGLVNFWTMDTGQLLDGFETLLARGGPKRVTLPEAPSMRLVGFLGSRGVKTSALKSRDDYFRVAGILWGLDSNLVKSYRDLERMIAGMSKRQRKRATDNLRKVPVQFLSGSEAAQ